MTTRNEIALGKLLIKGANFAQPQAHLGRQITDYVILHELCHLRELNHSRAFYALLDRVVPDWQNLRAKLNKSEVGS